MSGFGPYKWYGWVQHTSKNLVCCLFTGWTGTRTHETMDCTRFGISQWFWSPVLHFGYFYPWSQWGIQMVITSYQLWHIVVIFWCIGRLDYYNEEWHASNHILRMSVNSLSIIFDLVFGQSVRQLDADIHNWGIGHHYSQRSQQHTHCPIQKICVNGASTICGLVGLVINLRLHCCDAWCKFCVSVGAKVLATTSLPSPEHRCQKCMNNFPSSK